MRVDFYVFDTCSIEVSDFGLKWAVVDIVCQIQAVEVWQPSWVTGVTLGHQSGKMWFK